MSIYLVYLPSWYPKSPQLLFKRSEYPNKAAMKEELDRGKHLHETSRAIVEQAKCHECGKKVQWKKAWAFHSLPWVGGDVWCSKKCAIKS